MDFQSKEEIMGKKVLGIIVIVISVLVLLLSLGGVVGTWVLRSKVTGVVGDVVTLADTTIQRAQDAAGRVDSRLEQTRSTITTINTTISTIGDKVEDNNVVLQAIDQIAGTSLAPAVDNISSTTNDLYNKVVAVNSKVETLSRIPPFRGRGDILDKVNNVLNGVIQVGQDLANFRQGLSDAKSSITQRTTAVLTAPLTRIDNTLQSIQTAVGGVQQTLSDAQASVTAFQSTVLFWLNVETIVMTLLLLWIAVSQYSMILRGWAMFRVKSKDETPVLSSPEGTTPKQTIAGSGALPVQAQESAPVESSTPSGATSAPDQEEPGQAGDKQEDLTN
jgi:hypothetical protein